MRNFRAPYASTSFVLLWQVTAKAPPLVVDGGMLEQGGGVGRKPAHRMGKLVMKSAYCGRPSATSVALAHLRVREGGHGG